MSKKAGKTKRGKYLRTMYEPTFSQTIQPIEGKTRRSIEVHTYVYTRIKNSNTYWIAVVDIEQTVPTRYFDIFPLIICKYVNT